MDDRVGIADHAVQELEVEDRALDQLHIDAGEVVGEAGREVVQRHHVGGDIWRGEVAADRRTDEPGPAGDEHAHPPERRDGSRRPDSPFPPGGRAVTMVR